jgi:hypothetical protein
LPPGPIHGGSDYDDRAPEQGAKSRLERLAASTKPAKSYFAAEAIAERFSTGASI